MKASIAMADDGFTAAQWSDASGMSLRCAPISPEANQLVTAMLDATSGARRSDVGQQRPSSQEKRRKALGALLADLLKFERDGQVGFHGVRPEDFPAKRLGFGRNIFVALKDDLVAAGLLLFQPGRQRLAKFNNLDTGVTHTVATQGYVARFRLTDKALALAAGAGVSLADWSNHWGRLGGPVIAPQLVIADLSLIERRTSKAPGERTGKQMPIDRHHPKVITIIEDLAAHNSFVAAAGVGGIDFVGLRRIFNDGDAPGFDWNRGGRFYAIQPKGLEAAYENMKGAERRSRITLGGEAVGEADFSASQLRLFYALSGRVLREGLADDPYTVPGLDRNIVKDWVAQALGKGSPGGRMWSPRAKAVYRKANPGRQLSQDFPFVEFSQAMLGAHPLLGTLGMPGALPVLELQFHESEIMRLAMADLRSQDVPSLPVHDSLILPRSRLEDGRAALLSAFRAHVEHVTDHPLTVLPVVNLKVI